MSCSTNAIEELSYNYKRLNKYVIEDILTVMSKFSTVQKVNDVTTVNITAAIDSVTHILYSIVSITSLTKHVQYAAKNISQTFIYISRLIHQDGTPICQGHCKISYHKRFIDIRNTYSTITTKLSHSQTVKV